MPIEMSTAAQTATAAHTMVEHSGFLVTSQPPLSSPHEPLGAAFRAQLRPAILGQVDEWLSDRDHVGLKRFLGKRVAVGRGRTSTANILTAIYVILRHGEAGLNLADIARETGYSRQTVYRAVAYVARPKRGHPKLLRVHPERTGPRRPGWWDIRQGIIPTTDEFWGIYKKQEHALSSLSVNLPKNSPRKEKNNKPQADCAAPGRQCLSFHGNPAGWLKSPDVNLARVPSWRERRHLAVAIRAMDLDEHLTEAILSALFWRSHAPLALWKSVVDTLAQSHLRLGPTDPRRLALASGGFRSVDVRTEQEKAADWRQQTPEKMQWRIRLALKILIADPTASDAFLRAIEVGVPLATPKAIEHRVVVLDDMIIETEAALAAVKNAAKASRRKRAGAPCPECGKPIRAETRKPRQRCNPPPRYEIVNGYVRPIPLKHRMLEEYSEHGVYDFFQVISQYPDSPGGIWQTRRGAHPCPERLAKRLRELRSEREQLSTAHSPKQARPDLAKRTRARVAGIDAALARLHPARDRERIAWLSSKRSRLAQVLSAQSQGAGSPQRSSIDLPLERRVWLKLAKGFATASELARDLQSAERDIDTALGWLSQRFWAHIVDQKTGLWCAVEPGKGAWDAIQQVR